MSNKTFVATVRLSNGSQQKVEVQASNQLNAKAMIESQYGKGSIVVPPLLVVVRSNRYRWFDLARMEALSCDYGLRLVRNFSIREPG